MSISKFIFALILNLLFYSQSTANCQEIPEITVGTNLTINLSPNTNYLYNFVINETQLDEGQFIVFSTNPNEYLKPAFIYIALTPDKPPSPDNRDYSSQETGKNIIFINKTEIENQEGELKYLYLCINSLEETTVELEVKFLHNISLEDYKGIRPKLKLGDISGSKKIISFTYNTTEYGNKKIKILFYSLGENINYFTMKVRLVHGTTAKNYNAKQRFENGLGAIIDFDDYTSSYIKNSKINIIITSSNEKYMNRKVEVGYEVIDENENIIREINIMEHIWGMTKKFETCYKIKEEDITKINKAIMLINIFSQSIEFNIKDSNNTKLYSLDVFNNYFIRFPQNIYNNDTIFCFKHTTPKDPDKEVFGEVSYDFQIYYESELNKYQMFIMPLINGKIYTHSLNRGDIIVYRHNYYGNNTENNEKNVYSANMLKIRGNPKLYGFNCNEYPNNCNIDNNMLNKNIIDKIYSLNMYNINKRLNAVGNIDIDNNGEALYEQRNQYLTIVSCESEETDPNQGECKYTIEINNERDEVQLIPETVFATIIMNPINYFLIRVSDYKSIKYLKIYFTVLIGNAEMFIYEDSQYQNEITSYNFRHVHRKEIIEISENLKENYYLIIKCQDKAFIQLKYVTNLNYKGYNNLIPNEINIEPINTYENSYYNLYNPNYYFPFENETRNNDFYYKVETIDCLMTFSNVSQTISNLTEYNFEMEKNKLYYYLSTYGFYAKIDKYFHNYYNRENCGLIIYNGEISENRPLFVISDKPHISKFINTSYVYPIIYDENNDQGILIEFKIYDKEESLSNYYQLTYYMLGETEKHCEDINDDYYTLYLNKDYYGNFLKDNIFGILYIKLSKTYPEEKYTITSNFMSSKISPEYIYSNKINKISLRRSSSKYYYSQINYRTNGYLKYTFPKNESIKVYAKIVEKRKVESGYNWNGRIKLPEEGDSNLIEEINDGIIEYNIKYLNFVLNSN